MFYKNKKISYQSPKFDGIRKIHISEKVFNCPMPYENGQLEQLEFKVQFYVLNEERDLCRDKGSNFYFQILKISFFL